LCKLPSASADHVDFRKLDLTKWVNNSNIECRNSNILLIFKKYICELNNGGNTKYELCAYFIFRGFRLRIPYNVTCLRQWPSLQTENITKGIRTFMANDNASKKTVNLKLPPSQILVLLLDTRTYSEKPFLDHRGRPCILQPYLYPNIWPSWTICKTICKHLSCMHDT